MQNTAPPSLATIEPRQGLLVAPSCPPGPFLALGILWPLLLMSVRSLPQSELSGAAWPREGLWRYWGNVDVRVRVGLRLQWGSGLRRS